MPHLPFEIIEQLILKSLEIECAMNYEELGFSLRKSVAVAYSMLGAVCSKWHWQLGTRNRLKHQLQRFIKGKFELLLKFINPVPPNVKS